MKSYKNENSKYKFKFKLVNKYFITFKWVNMLIIYISGFFYHVMKVLTHLSN